MDVIRKTLCIITITLLFTGCSSNYNNYAECILENMPGVTNESSRHAITQKCGSEFPEGMNTIQQGQNLGLFSKYDNKNECVIDLNKSTSHPNAARQVNRACYCLYEKPSWDGEMCGYKNVPAGFKFDPNTARPVTQQ